MRRTELDDYQFRAGLEAEVFTTLLACRGVLDLSFANFIDVGDLCFRECNSPVRV